MTPFTVVESVAASLDKDNIDTDMIIPVQFMKTVSKTGLKDGLFYSLRHPSNSNSEGFILDRKPFTQAQIIVSGNNFGCGSSREHAPWALKDFGIKVIIAGSFADIFFNNCMKNGILLIALPAGELREVREAAESGLSIKVDLRSQTISAQGVAQTFLMEEYRRNYLLEGRDEISSTLMRTEMIDHFERGHRAALPWLFDRKPDFTLQSWSTESFGSPSGP